jgi:hypothetical protein
VRAALVLALLLAGCAAPPPVYYRNFLHAGAGQLEYDQHLYLCRRENTRMEYTRVGQFADWSATTDEDGARACMRALGWRAVTPG